MYELVRRGAIRKRRYFDAAYTEGYLNGLISLDLDKSATEHLPLYFVWGSGELVTFDDFARALERARQLHKAATAEAKRLVSDIPEGLVVQHTPFLDTEGYVEAAAPKGVAPPPGKA